MSGWLSKAAKAFGPADEVPQLFELVCECGQKHSGVRRQRHQHIVCRTCGASLFVLPRDVYPPPRSVTKSQQRGHLVAESPAEGEAERSRGRGKPNEKSVKTLTPPVAPSDKKLDSPVSQEKDRLKKKLSAPKGKLFSGFRLIVGGIVLLVAGTIFWSVRSSGNEEARIRLAEASKEAQSALEKGDWVAASNFFEEGKLAADRLGRTDATAQKLRQGYKETYALKRLLTESLFEMLEAGEKAESKEAWAEKFRSKYAGLWVVIEVPVTRAERYEPKEKKHKLLFQVNAEIPWTVGEQNRVVELRADFEDFQKLNLGRSAKNAIFAGQIEDCRLENETWLVVLNAQTGFLWSHPHSYAALSFGFDETHTESAVEQLLAEQSKALGLSGEK